MKIRIKGNSFRIRLTRSEVDQFAETGYLEETTEFGSNSFVYALQSMEGIPGLEADYEENKMTMYVPSNIPAVWAKNETVGYENNMEIGDGKHLFLLLEKDFKCIDAPAHEDQSDNFENPHKVC
jgi:hypothetical protein